MKKIVCTLPNASNRINGIAFESTLDGMVSEPVEDAVAAHFEGIAGYDVIEIKPAAASKKAKADAAPVDGSPAGDAPQGE